MIDQYIVHVWIGSPRRESAEEGVSEIFRDREQAKKWADIMITRFQNRGYSPNEIHCYCYPLYHPLYESKEKSERGELK